MTIKLLDHDSEKSGRAVMETWYLGVFFFSEMIIVLKNLPYTNQKINALCFHFRNGIKIFLQSHSLPITPFFPKGVWKRGEAITTLNKAQINLVS